MRTLGELEQSVLLAVIRLGDRAYGIAVQDVLESRAGRTLKFGSVYSTLDRLEAKGFLSVRIGDPTPERGGRAKRFFRLTNAGHIALTAALTARRNLEIDLNPEDLPIPAKGPR